MRRAEAPTSHPLLIRMSWAATSLAALFPRNSCSHWASLVFCPWTCSRCVVVSPRPNSQLLNWVACICVYPAAGGRLFGTKVHPQTISIQLLCSIIYMIRAHSNRDWSDLLYVLRVLFIRTVQRFVCGLRGVVQANFFDGLRCCRAWEHCAKHSTGWRWNLFMYL